MTATSIETNPWESNSTQETPDSLSPGNTPQSPFSAPMDPPSTTFPITTSLIPASMISMNGIPLPPTMQRICHSKQNVAQTNNNHPRTDSPSSSSSRSRSRHRKTRSTSPDNPRSRSRDRTSKLNQTSCSETTCITSDHSNTPNTEPNVCDLTGCITPISSSESENNDSDIEIIETIMNPPNNINNARTTHVTISDNEDNFERYTLGGIGGKLLRKAGWDGNTDDLNEKEGPIAQSKKYQSLQRNKNGLGYVFTYAHKKRNTKRAYVYPLLTRPRPLPPPNRNTRVRMPNLTMHKRTNHNNNNGAIAARSNTMDTAIEISDDDEDTQQDDDVMVLDKYQVTQRRLKHLNGTVFDTIIKEMRCEKEETTKACIVKQFAGSKRRIAITKMVISIKDSYSQTKIIVPVRGKNCKHLQPFDAKCFLLRPKKYQKCTQCNMSIKKKDLIKMVYFEKIFADIEDEVEQIEIMKNAEWKVVEQKQAKQRHVMQEERSVVNLESEDEEEEDVGKRTMMRNVVDLLETSDSDCDRE